MMPPRMVPVRVSNFLESPVASVAVVLCACAAVAGVHLFANVLELLGRVCQRMGAGWCRCCEAFEGPRLHLSQTRGSHGKAFEGPRLHLSQTRGSHGNAAVEATVLCGLVVSGEKEG